MLALLAPAGAGAQNLPEVKILRGSNPTSVTEGQDVTFTLTRPAPSDNVFGGGPDGSLNLTVRVRVTDRGDFIRGQPPTTVTFEGNATNATLRVRTDDDDVDEADGSVTARLLHDNDDEYQVDSGNRQLTTTVTDNDAQPVVSMAAQDYEIDEGDSAVFVLTRSGDPSKPLTIPYGAAPGVGRARPRRPGTGARLRQEAPPQARR